MNKSVVRDERFFSPFEGALFSGKSVTSFKRKPDRVLLHVL
jgi:hypothetical protein